MPLYVATGVGGLLIIFGLGRLGLSSPWLNAKAMAEASPALVAAGAAGAAAMFETGRRVEATLIGAAIAVGVLWSNGLAYSNAWLAPRARLAELEQVGTPVRRPGADADDRDGAVRRAPLPAEPRPRGRRRAPAAADPPPRRAGPRQGQVRRPRPVPTGGGPRLQDDRPRPLAEREPSAVGLPARVERSLLRRLAAAQRPAADPRPHAARGRRAAGRCAAVRRSHAARDSGRAIRPRWPLRRARPRSSSTSWACRCRPGGRATPAATCSPRRAPGRSRKDFTVPRAGRYGLWLGGSFRGRLRLYVDGRLIADARHRLNSPGYEPLGKAVLRAGRHRLMLRYDGADLHPGSGGTQFGLGPLILSRGPEDVPVVYVPSAEARRLAAAHSTGSKRLALNPGCSSRQRSGARSAGPARPGAPGDARVDRRGTSAASTPG